MKSLLASKWLKVAVFALCLAPAGELVWEGFHNELGANPIEFITHATGDWILIFLVLTLSVSPARKLLRLPELIRSRRMLGLFAFFYACLHFTTYIWLDQFFNIHSMIQDVGKRPFITAGFTGFVLMIPLAVTSTAGWIRRMGGKRWRNLHSLIYVSACAGVVHYYWQVKSDERKPIRYGIIVALLLGYRLGVWIYEKRKAARSTDALPRKEFETAESV